MIFFLFLFIIICSIFFSSSLRCSHSSGYAIILCARARSPILIITFLSSVFRFLFIRFPFCFAYAELLSQTKYNFLLYSHFLYFFVQKAEKGREKKTLVFMLFIWMLKLNFFFCRSFEPIASHLQFFFLISFAVAVTFFPLTFSTTQLLLSI